MRKKLGVLPQYIAPQRLLTTFAGWLSERRWVWFKNWQINHLVHRYGASLSEAEFSNVADYPTFNSFFTRQLKPGLRPIAPEPDALASPADGTISQLGFINKDLLFQAKGFHYSLESLLGGSPQLASLFTNGDFATIYLSPKDYHRIHMPLTGTLRETIFIPGRLFSVSTKTAESIPNLFARNERLICLFDTEVGPIAVILVGAMLVGSINTLWFGTYRHDQITQVTYPVSGPQSVQFMRGAELGHFKMGSTVIMLLPKNTVNWSPHLNSHCSVKMGQFLGKVSVS
jgi:phosphatidylserine decarboxylase